MLRSKALGSAVSRTSRELSPNRLADVRTTHAREPMRHGARAATRRISRPVPRQARPT